MLSSYPAVNSRRLHDEVHGANSGPRTKLLSRAVPIHLSPGCTGQASVWWGAKSPLASAMAAEKLTRSRRRWQQQGLLQILLLLLIYSRHCCRLEVTAEWSMLQIPFH